MSHKTRHWGEFEDGLDEQPAHVPRSFLNRLIEASLQPQPVVESEARGAPIELPVQNVTLLTARLVEHNRKAAAAVGAGEPPPPAEVFDDGFGGKLLASSSKQSDTPRPVPAFGSAARKLALAQAVALTLASRPGFVSVTRSALDTLVDAVEQFIRIITSTMRTVVDKEAASHPSGFPDVMSKVFTELGITGLQAWYKDHVLGSHQVARRGFEEAPIAEVPQLHFPAGLEELSDSLEPGFQMLQTLESGQLPTLHLLDGDSDHLDLNDSLLDDPSPPVSPTIKKKRKLSDM